MHGRVSPTLWKLPPTCPYLDTLSINRAGHCGLAGNTTAIGLAAQPAFAALVAIRITPAAGKARPLLLLVVAHTSGPAQHIPKHAPGGSPARHSLLAGAVSGQEPIGTACTLLNCLTIRALSQRNREGRSWGRVEGSGHHQLCAGLQRCFRAFGVSPGCAGAGQTPQ